MSLESRLHQVEKILGAEEGRRPAYSHAQLVLVARHIAEHGELALERWPEVCGEPDTVLEPGEPSHAELIVATVRASRICDAAKSAGKEASHASVFQDCLEQLLAPDGGTELAGAAERS